MIEGNGTIEMATTKLTNTIIEAAIYGFEAQKRSIDAQIAELRALMTGAPESPSTKEGHPRRKRRKLSPEAIKRMREGQQRRWAKARGESQVSATATSKPKRKISAAGRKAISAAMKKRWAAKKAAA